MRSRITIAAFLVCATALPPITANAQGSAVKQYTIEQFMTTTAVRGAAFSPDGTKILVSSAESGIFNAYALAVDGSGPTQLTFSKTDAIFARSYFPSDERFIYEADQGGNELTHVYVQTPNGTSKDITPRNKLKAGFAGWADDEESFFISSNERDSRYFDLYEVQADSYQRTLIYKNESGYGIACVSPDKRYIALSKTVTRSNREAFIHDRETGETRTLIKHDVEAIASPQTFSRDGKYIYALTDLNSEFRYLVKEDLGTGEKSVVYKDRDWDVMYGSLSKTGAFHTFGVNNDGRMEARVFSTGGALRPRRVAFPVTVPIDRMASVSFSRDEKAIAYYLQNGRSPNDLYYYHFGEEEPVRLTWRLNREIDPLDLVEPKVVRFTSYDGTVIPGVLYKPHQASPNNKVPALVLVHGGPGGQTRPNYHALTQYLVNHGYAIYGINNRGSSGYGKTFYAMDDLKHGDADLDDCVASKQMLIDTGWVDAGRIGILGQSYGGYMVCAALAFRPEEFEVGVDIFGVTNWVRTLKSIPSWWEATRNGLYKELGDPFTQEEYLRKISPLFHAKNIVKPTIVLQGKNDPRVLQVESDEMVAAIRANEVPVEYIVFEDEGHGFRKTQNQITGYKAILKFLDKHLKQEQKRILVDTLQ